MGIGKLFSLGFRALKAAPKLVFGTNSESVGKVIRNTYKGASSGSVFSKAVKATKEGFKSLEKGATGKAFLKGVFSDIKSLPKFLTKATKVGSSAAKAAGKSSIWGGVKGFFGGVCKKMPLIGTLIAIGCEVPNIYKAGKEEGAGSALKETGKAAARLAGGAAGAAIGSAICPGIGTLIGWVAGEWLTGLVTGKTYTEKKEEAEEKAQAEQEIQQLKDLGLSDEEIAYVQEQGLSVDQVKELVGSQGTAKYSDADVQKLKQLGLTDDEISYAQENGFSVDEIEQLLKKQEAKQPEQSSATGVSKPETQGTSQTSTADNNLDYASMVRSMYGNYAPFSYQPTIPNVYTNDMFYQQAFGYASNPFMSGTNPFMVPFSTNGYFQYTA